MAILTNTATTFTSAPGIAGIREDLADIIYNTSPTDTPFINNIGKQKVSNTLYEWQMDTLAADDTTNAQLQGDDLGTTGYSAASVTTRLNNRTQISRKTVVIDGTLASVDLAGRADEMAYQLMKRGKELKNDIEAIFVGVNQAKVTGNITAAPKTAAVLSWITVNSSKGTSGGDPATADGAGIRTDGTTRVFTEALLKTVLQLIWAASSETPDSVMLGGGQKQVMSTFTGNANRQVDAKGNAIFASIDVYDYDFGRIKVMPNRHMRSRDALILDHSMWGVGWLRPIASKVMAVTGDADKRMLIGEYGLVARNERSSGIVADLS